MIKKVGIIVGYNGFSYFIGEGFKNVFKNTKSTVISVVTMMCTMFLFGIFFAIGVNINSILEQVQMKQGMEVFIYDDTTTEQIDKFESEISKLKKGVELEGRTLVPLKLYFSKNHAKILLALCKGKKNFDKREVIKERDLNREKAKLHKYNYH